MNISVAVDVDLLSWFTFYVHVEIGDDQRVSDLKDSNFGRTPHWRSSGVIASPPCVVA